MRLAWLSLLQFLGGDRVDHFLRQGVDVDDQSIDAADEEDIEDRGGNGHGQAAGGVEQGLGDAAGQQFGAAQGIAGGDHVEGLDHAQHGPHQAQQGPDGGDGVEDAEIAAEAVGHALAAVDDRLFDFDGGASPFVHCPGEDFGHRAAAFLAQRQGLLAVQFAVANCWRKRVTNGLGITRPRRRLIARSSTKVTSRNEQTRMGTISGPASRMIRHRSVVGMASGMIRHSGIQVPLITLRLGKGQVHVFGLRLSRHESLIGRKMDQSPLSLSYWGGLGGESNDEESPNGREPLRLSFTASLFRRKSAQ